MDGCAQDDCIGMDGCAQDDCIGIDDCGHDGCGHDGSEKPMGARSIGGRGALNGLVIWLSKPSHPSSSSSEQSSTDLTIFLYSSVSITSIIAVPIFGEIPNNSCSEIPDNGSRFCLVHAFNNTSTGCSKVARANGDMSTYFAIPCLVVAVMSPECVIQSTRIW